MRRCLTCRQRHINHGHADFVPCNECADAARRRAAADARRQLAKPTHDRGRMAADMRDFWSRVRGSSKGQRLALLQDFADRVYEYPPAWLIDHRRDQFGDLERRVLSGDCFVCHLPAQCRHHIIQIQHGGLNRRDNVVGLCHPCHAVIHPWLSTETQSQVRPEPPSTPEPCPFIPNRK